MTVRVGVSHGGFGAAEPVLGPTSLWIPPLSGIARKLTINPTGFEENRK